MKVAILFMCGALLCAACSRSHTSETVSVLNYEKIATLCKSSGDHLNASYYFEAALEDHSSINVPLLRLLVEEQILAGRLLAARMSLKQLESIVPGDKSVMALRNLVEQLTGGRVVSLSMEVSR